MPVETRPADAFTRDSLLIGFSVVTFTPTLPAGGPGAPISLGILSSQALTKEVELLALNQGNAGTLTVDREIVSQLKVKMDIETFNWTEDVAQLVLAAASSTPVSADAAQAVTDEAVTVPSGQATLLANSQQFSDLNNGLIDDTASLVLTCAPVTEIILGDGTGDTPGDYALKYKPLVFGDVTAATETVTATGVVTRTFSMVDTTSAGATELGVQDGVIATSGDLDLSQVVPVGSQLNITYTPTHTLEEDFDAASPDMLLDPLLGRVRFPNIDSAAAKDATSAIRTTQPLLLDYTYNRLAHHTMQPFTQGGLSFDGTATIKHLTDVGVNFLWTIPSVTLLVTDEDVSFGAEDFATASLQMNINDAGGSDRFGTLLLSTETEAGS